MNAGGTVRARLNPVRRLWPRKVRTRLTLIYAVLFLVAGSALLGLAFGVVANSLPTSPPTSPRSAAAELKDLALECKSGPARYSASLLRSRAGGHRTAYNAGTVAGLQAQRQRALSKLLSFSPSASGS